MPPASADFTCVVGIDGAGKSTVLSAVRARRPDLAIVDWRDAQRVLFPGSDGEDRLRRALDVGSPLQRAELLVRLHEMQVEQVRSQLAAGRPVIVDSYWYKVAAREERLGRSDSRLIERLARLPRPRAVVFLEIDPIVARARKRALTAFEHPGDPSRFAEFQRCVQQRIHQLVTGLDVYLVPADGTPGDVADAVLAVVQTLQPPATSGRPTAPWLAVGTK